MSHRTGVGGQGTGTGHRVSKLEEAPEILSLNILSVTWLFSNHCSFILVKLPISLFLKIK